MLTMAATTSPYPTTVKREENGDIVFTITLPKAEVEKVRKEEVAKMAQAAKLPGFRAGKAPKEMIETKLDPEKVREATLKQLLPTAYVMAVNEQKVKPIINPRINVTKLDDEGDWEFEAITCETPEVVLGDYKKDVQAVTAAGKILKPGQTEVQKPKLEDIVKVLLEKVTVKVPQVLIEGEAERLLSQLLGEIKKLGLSLDQYMASTGKTIETLKAEYEGKARGDIALEFILQAIANDAKLEVGQKEIDEALATAKSPEEKEAIQKNIYMVTTILRQQKTLDFLANL